MRPYSRARPVTGSHDRTGRSERGSAAIELPVLLGLILIPFGLLIVTVPTWVERQTAGRDAAAELARAIVTDSDSNSAIVASIESGYELPTGTLRPNISGESIPGESVTVEVVVAMPAVDLPLFGSFGSVSWAVEHTERYPDYGVDNSGTGQ